MISQIPTIEYHWFLDAANFFLEEKEVTFDVMVKHLHKSKSKVTKIDDKRKEILKKWFETNENKFFEEHNSLLQKLKLAIRERINNKYCHVDFVIPFQFGSYVNLI